MGNLFLGENTYLNIKELSTHTFVCGATGSGKTVTSKIIIEEALLNDIPVLAFDLKGDISSLIYPLKFYAQEKFDRFKLGSLEKYYSNLEKYGYSRKTIESLKNKLKVNFYSPLGANGIPLGFSPIPKKPLDNDLIPSAKNFASSTLLSLIKSSKDFSIENAFIQALIDYFWNNNMELTGLKGLKILISAITNPPINSVGVRDVNDFISPQKRENLANLLNASFVSYKDFFQGVDINEMDKILGEGRSLNIIDLSQIQNFSMQSQIIALTAYSIFNWMKLKGQSEKPRLLVFIDEIGGGGGNTSLLPPDPYFPPSKMPLRLLLRQGRAFGVSLILATQSPGDVDYKSLANCLTWFVGKLIRDRDRKKVLETAIDTFNGEVKNFENTISTVEKGNMILLQKSGYKVFKCRWLLTPHKTLSKNEKNEILQYLYDPNKSEGASNKNIISKTSSISFEKEAGSERKDQITQEEPETSKTHTIIKNKDEFFIGVIDEVINDMEDKINALKGNLSNNLKQSMDILDKVRKNLNLLKDMDLKAPLAYLDHLSKNELLAVFDGVYSKKVIFSIKQFTAPLLKDSFKESITKFQTELSLIENKLSYFGQSKPVDVISEFNEFLISLKEIIFASKRSSEIEIKELIVNKIVNFFSIVLNNYFERVVSIENELNSKYNNILNELKDKLKIEHNLYDTISVNTKQYFKIYDFILNYKIYL